MKAYLALLIAVFSTSAFAQYLETDKIAESEYKGAARILSAGTSTGTSVFDVKYYRLELKTDFDSIEFKGLSGTITTIFIAEKSNLAELVFDLSSNMKVEKVLYHDISVAFHTNSNQLHISLPYALDEGTLDSVSVFYSGFPNATGFGSFKYEKHNGVPIVSTLSEPFGASDWWPCKNNLTDKADSVDIIVTCPAGFKVASNGLLVGLEEGELFSKWHWKHRYPIATYLIAFAVTNYWYEAYKVKLQEDSLLVENFVFPESIEAYREGKTELVKFIKLYDSLFVAYPFKNEKYGQAQFLSGGGMEHQTMSFMTNYGFELEAHELAHHWFGDMITCGSWQDLWLNEGFATYCTGLAYEKTRIGEPWWNRWRRLLVDNITSKPDGAVWVADTLNIQRLFNSRLTYQKGAYLLHMLRWKLGDEVFFQAVRNYLSDPFLRYRNARTDDFIGYLENESGEDLTGFFKDWFYGEGFPSYFLSWDQLDNEVWINLKQSTSHSSVDFFELPVPVQFIGNHGKDTVLVFDNTYSGQSWQFRLPFQVDSVKIDPEIWLISANNKVEKNPLTSILDEKKNPINCFPNPVIDVLTIEANVLIVGEIEIVDLSGKRMKNNTVSANNINVSELQTGWYILKIKGDNGYYYSKFFKK